MIRMRWLVRIVAVVYWAAIFGATHLPPAKVPTTHVSDKLEHFIGYFLLAAMLYLATRTLAVAPMRAMLIVLIVSLAYGVFDEQTQKLVGRDCSLYDWLADAAGAALAACISLALSLSARRGSSM